MDALKDAPGGVHIILKGVGLRGTPLMAIGYRYACKSTLFFIASQDAGSTKPGKPYEMKFTDEFGNVCVRFVDRPKILSEFFQDSNVIDSFNHVRQFELAMEKKWPTHNGYFRLQTTMEGIGVTQTWYLARHHKLFDKFGLNCNMDISEDGLQLERKIPIRKFAGILAKQLLTKASKIGMLSEISVTADSNPLPSSSVAVTNSTFNDDISTLDSSNRGNQEHLRDKYGQVHPMHLLQKRTTKKGKIQRMQRFCQRCRDVDGLSANSSTICITCNRAFCTPSSFNGRRDCYQAHVNNCGLFPKAKRMCTRQETNV